MGAERVVRWGPPELSQVVTDQLWRHGLGSADAVACARELAAAVGPAARASSFVDLGGCRFLDGDIAGALGAWQQAIVSGQTAPSARALFNLGLLHEHLGLYDDAVQRFEAAEAHGVAPYGDLATLARARAQDRAGHHERAMATLARLADRLMEAGPDTPMLGETLLGLGDVAERAGQLDRAEQAYRAAMQTSDEIVTEQASLSLVDVLRFIGHDEEAQQIVEDAGLVVADPVVALDRVELLIRLGRFDEAETVLDDLDTEVLSVADQFRLATTQIDLGRVNAAIDVLEALAGEGAPETRARAAYRLGEVYLGHEMTEPAAAMFATARGIQPGYWADKASLALGDLAMVDGRHRIAAAHWADAAASRIESVSTSARERLVDAVVPTPAPVSAPLTVPPAQPEVAAPLPMAPGPDVKVRQEAASESPNEAVDLDGPATEAVDMRSLLDDPADDLMVPGEITPVAGVLMALPEAEGVDVEVPAEPLVPVLPEPPAPVASRAPEPLDVAPPAPTVIPLRRRSAAPEAQVPEAASPDVGSADDSAAAGDIVVNGAETDLSSSSMDVPHGTNGALDTNRSANADSIELDVRGTDAESADDAAGAPLVIKLGRERTERSVEPEAEPVIDLRDAEPTSGNPYAALAPEALEGDPRPSDRNPYAELAPNFGGKIVSDLRGDDEDEPGPSTFSNFA